MSALRESPTQEAPNRRIDEFLTVACLVFLRPGFVLMSSMMTPLPTNNTQVSKEVSAFHICDPQCLYGSVEDIL